MFTSDAPIPPEDRHPPMTPHQIELARHALGLDGKRKQSYRNRFCVGPGADDFEEWVAMTEAGFAKRVSKERMQTVEDMFFLTPSGAAQALLLGERFDPEDFPKR